MKETTITVRQQGPERKVVGFVGKEGSTSGYVWILGTSGSGGGYYNPRTGNFHPGVWQEGEFNHGNYTPLYSGDQIVITTTTTTEEVKTL